MGSLLTILKPWKVGLWIIGFKVYHFQPAIVLPASCLGPMSASSKHLNIWQRVSLKAFLWMELLGNRRNV